MKDKMDRTGEEPHKADATELTLPQRINLPKTWYRFNGQDTLGKLITCPEEIKRIEARVEESRRNAIRRMEEQ